MKEIGAEEGHATPMDDPPMMEYAQRGEMGPVESWIGTDQEIERMLFWDKGGKFDDPQWAGLSPLDETSRDLYERAKRHYETLRRQAVENQKHSDMTLHSEFNRALLFTGLSGAVRCNDSGREDPRGEYFRGVELRCIGSVEENINAVTIYPSASGGLEVHFGGRSRGLPQGILVYSGDAYSLIQLGRLVEGELSGAGYEASLEDTQGNPVSLDLKGIRRAARKGQEGFKEPELVLKCTARAREVAEALERADHLSRSLYERFGLEIEGYKIGKKYKNFFILRNDNFHRFLPETSVKTRGLVLFTATPICRRCRREVEGFRDFARWYPDVTFALVNLSSPQSRFYERVFGDMGGGDPQNFRKSASGVTPFTIVYVPDRMGRLRFAEYLGTGAEEAPPSKEASLQLFEKYFGQPGASGLRSIGMSP